MASEHTPNLFKAIFEKSNDAIFVVDPQSGRFLHVNEKACKNLGYTEKELLSLKVLDIEAVIPNKEKWKKHQQGVKLKGSKIVEGRHKRKDGTTFPVEVTIAVLSLDKDYLIGIARDITGRKEAEQNLKTVITATSPKVGKGFLDTLTKSVAKALNVSFAFISEFAGNKDTLRTVSFVKNGKPLDTIEYPIKDTPCQEVIEKQKSYLCSRDVQAKFPKDEFLVVENVQSYLAIPFFGSDGKIMGHMGVMDTKPLIHAESIEPLLSIFAVRAGTELEREKKEGQLHQAYNYLDTILLNLPVGLAILEGPEFKFFRINKVLADINGRSVEDHLGKPLAEILPHAVKDTIPRLRKVLETGKAALEHEFSTNIKDPSDIHWFVDSYFPICDKEGKPIAVGAMVTEITEKKKAEQQRLTLQKQLETYAALLEKKARLQENKLNEKKLFTMFNFKNQPFG